MRSRTIGSSDIGYAIPSGDAEPPLYRSRYGGLWVDRSDAHGILDARRTRGEVSEADAELLGHFIDFGYVVFPKVVDEAVIDDYLDLFEAAWDAPPDLIWVECQRKVVSIDRKYYDKSATASDVHSCFARAGELIFPSPVLRFLTQIYERPPVVFLTRTMRKGSEERLHFDTGGLTLTEPLSLANSWLALEDVRPFSGEFHFIPGSHHIPELLHFGTDKGHKGDYDEHYRILMTALRMCEERGLKAETFMAKKGDMLIWHADLMHGALWIQDRQRTRKSLVAHFMPLGVMPTYVDFSKINAVPYPTGGYCTDRILHDTAPRPRASRLDGEPAAGTHRRTRPIDLWRSWVPLSVREHIPPSFAEWTRHHSPRLLDESAPLP
jgi:ectoine hydroxylase-related dioxygenase (phytanoyl-CoA dioxygenase family)